MKCFTNFIISEKVSFSTFSLCTHAFKFSYLPALRHCSTTISTDKNNFNSLESFTNLPEITSLEDNPKLEDVSDYAPYVSPAFNLAAFVNKSSSLKKLVDLGVDLHRVEKIKGVCEVLLQLKDEDIIKYLEFFGDIGIKEKEIGNVLTKNPLIFSQEFEDLQVRLSYLMMKKFSKESIYRIVAKNPRWLNYRSQDIDRRLGYFQSSFHLEGKEVRYLATKMPKIVTYNLRHIEETKFAVIEQMGFTASESKEIILNKPKLYTLNREELLSRFSLVHNIMGIPHNILIKHLGGILCRKKRLEERHEFLKFLCKAQYDPLGPGYISLESIVRGNDSEFCTKVAGTSVMTFNKFLKTL